MLSQGFKGLGEAFQGRIDCCDLIATPGEKADQKAVSGFQGLDKPRIEFKAGVTTTVGAAQSIVRLTRADL